MKTARLILYFCFLFSLSLRLGGAAAAPQPLLTAYLSRHRGAQTFQASFLQEKKIAVLNQVQKTSGQVLFKRPQKLVWTLAKPLDFKLILNGDKLTKIYGTLEEREETTLGQDPTLAAVLENIFMLMGLRHNEDIVKNYTVRETDRTITLVPRDKNLARYLREIVITPDGQGGARSLLLREQGDSYTLLTFSNVRLNGPLDDSLFAP